MWLITPLDIKYFIGVSTHQEKAHKKETPAKIYSILLQAAQAKGTMWSCHSLLNKCYVISLNTILKTVQDDSKQHNCSQTQPFSVITISQVCHKLEGS